MKFLRTIFGKSNAADGGTKVSLSDFRDAVLEELKEQAPELSIEKDEGDVALINIKSPDGIEGQSNMTNFHKELALFDGTLEDAIQKVIEGVLIAVRPAPPAALSDLLPLIRSAAYLGNASNETSQKISRPFCGELLEICMVDSPSALRGMTKDDLDQLDTEAPLSVARENVRKLLPKTFRDNSLEFAVLFSIEDHAHLAPSLVLFDEFWANVDKDYPNGCIIALPRRDQLFLINLADPNAVENAQHLVKVTFEDNFNLLTSELYIRRAGAISLLDVA